MEQKNYGYSVTSTFPDKEQINYEFKEYLEALDKYVELCEGKGRLCALVGGTFSLELKNNRTDKVMKSLVLNASEFDMF
jgi:RAB protein geranylgeranyltransferase component A